LLVFEVIQVNGDESNKAEIEIEEEDGSKVRCDSPMDETIEERDDDGRLTLTSHECTVQVDTHQVNVVVVSTLPCHTTVFECGISLH
jgi:hypothetical protein